MQNNRRQFLGSLARGLLLPIGGGALTFAESAKASNLQVTSGDLPLSADAMLLRSLKRELAAIQVAANKGRCSHRETDRDWHGLVQRQVKPLEAQMLLRPPATWADCVELAEICWWGVAHRRSHNEFVVSAGRARVFDDEDPRDALVGAVLSLGGGERFYPQGHARSSA